MPFPPDDLPRSPTGRVPQWVLDEATGHPRVVTGWREHESPVMYLAPRPVGTVRRPPVVRRRFVAALVATLVGAGGAAIVHSPDGGAGLRRSVEDWAWAAQRGPLPPASARDFPAPGYEEHTARMLAAPVPGASSTGFTYSQTQGSDDAGSPVTWSPCRPIHYVVNPTGAPGTFTADVARAVTEISAATGLAFVDDGATSEHPRNPRAPFQVEAYGDRWAPVLIAFTDTTSIPDLVGDVAGIGGATAAVDPRTGTTHYVSGIVYLDLDLLSAPPTGGEPSYVPILRHELGHLVGLGHTDESSQLMFPVDQGLSSFGAGDLTGLAALGQGPCARGV